MKAITMNHTSVSDNRRHGSIYAGNLLLGGAGLKSTQEKLERQQQASREVEFWEKQKENLKSRECETIEEIAKKLETFHTYEDEIKAVKMAYNQEQMFHVMDEAEEIGEKIAEAAEKLEPKTPEERREEAAEEAAGVEKNDGILSEILDELTEVTEELTEEMTEELVEEVSEELTDELAEGTIEEFAGELTEEEFVETLTEKALAEWKEQLPDQQAVKRMSIDIRV